MREIKFRAWDKENNVMFDVFGFDINHVVAWQREGIDAKILNPTPERDNCILMQYTGLKDKNGVEIYEGDIISNTDFTGDIYYSDRGTWDCASFILGGCNEKSEVIGNIYENKELLQN